MSDKPRPSGWDMPYMSPEESEVVGRKAAENADQLDKIFTKPKTENKNELDLNTQILLKTLEMMNAEAKKRLQAALEGNWAQLGM